MSVVRESIVSADHLVAFKSIELRDNPADPKVGLRIERYGHGYGITVSHEDISKNRLEFFIDKGDRTRNTAAVLTLSAGRTNTQLEIRRPGDLEGIAIDVADDGTVRLNGEKVDVPKRKK